MNKFVKQSGFALAETMVSVAVFATSLYVASTVYRDNQMVRARIFARLSVTELEGVFRAAVRNNLQEYLFNDLDQCNDAGKPAFFQAGVELAGISFGPSDMPSSLPTVKSFLNRYHNFKNFCQVSMESASSAVAANEMLPMCLRGEMSNVTQSDSLSRNYPFFTVSRIELRNVATNALLNCQQFVTLRNTNPDQVYALHDYNMIFIDKGETAIVTHTGIDVITHAMLANEPPSLGPTADLKINGNDGNLIITNGSPINISWTSTNAFAGCTLSPLGWNGAALSSTSTIPPSDTSISYQLSCSDGTTTVTDVMTVTTIPLPDPDLKINGDDADLSVVQNSNVTASWTSANAESCTLIPAGATPGTSHPGQAYGPMPLGVTTFTLTCVNAAGDSASESIQVTGEPPGLPMADLKVNGEDGPVIVPVGSVFIISWTSANVSSCAINVYGIPDTLENPGHPLGPKNSPGMALFKLKCAGFFFGSKAYDSVQVYFIDGTSAVTADLKINNSDGPVSIPAESDVSVSWTSNNATNCSFSHFSLSGASYSSQNHGPINSDTTFHVTCSNGTETASDFVTVTVEPADPDTTPPVGAGTCGLADGMEFTQSSISADVVSAGACGVGSNLWGAIVRAGTAPSEVWQWQCQPDGGSGGDYANCSATITPNSLPAVPEECLAEGITPLGGEVVVYLSLDRSGSMVYDMTGLAFSFPEDNPHLVSYLDGGVAYRYAVSPPHPTDSRWAVLSNAVDLYLEEVSESAVAPRTGLVTWSSDFFIGPPHMFQIEEAFLNVPIPAAGGGSWDANKLQIKNALTLIGQGPLGGDMDLSAGLDFAVNALKTQEADVPNKVVILMTDGLWNTGRHPRDAALDARDAGIIVHTITMLTEPQPDIEEVSQITGGRHYSTNDEIGLRQAFRDIAKVVRCISH